GEHRREVAPDALGNAARRRALQLEAAVVEHLSVTAAAAEEGQDAVALEERVPASGEGTAGPHEGADARVELARAEGVRPGVASAERQCADRREHLALRNDAIERVEEGHCRAVAARRENGARLFDGAKPTLDLLDGPRQPHAGAGERARDLDGDAAPAAFRVRVHQDVKTASDGAAHGSTLAIARLTSSASAPRA